MKETAGDPRAALALEGERLAALHLERAGCRIVARRWRRRYGELDLVAIDDGLVLFVEVKTRRGRGYGGAEAVTRGKQRRLALAASGFLASRDWGERPCRFDVIEVLARPGRPPRIRHLRDAFRPAAAGSRRH